MPITITPLPPVSPSTDQWVGWGIGIELNSDFVGPMPTGSFWNVQVASDDSLDNLIFDQDFPFVAKDQVVILGKTSTTDPWNYTVTPTTGDTIYVGATLHEPTSVVDTGDSIPGKWNDTAGIAQLIQWFGQQAVTGGGLTPTQAVQLETAATNTTDMAVNWGEYEAVTLPSLNDALSGILGAVSSTIQTAGGAIGMTLGQIFSGKTLDLLTTVDLSGGTTCDPIYAELGGGDFYGVVLQITSWPEWITWQGVDEGWSETALAVMTIRRGGSVLQRIGVHTHSVEVYPLPGIPTITVETSIPFTPPDYQIEVDWGTGVCGYLLGLAMP